MISGAEASATSSTRANTLIDNYLDGILSEFRAIRVWDERSRRTTEDPLLHRLTYRNLLPSSPVEVYDQNNNRVPPADVTGYSDGTFTVSTDDGNRVYFATYDFNYFPSELLKQFLDITMAELNASADQQTYVTSYTLDSAPAYYDGPLIAGTLAKAYRKLVNDSMLWKNYMIYQNGDTMQQQMAAASQEAQGMFMELRLGAKRVKFLAKPGHLYEMFRNTGFGGVNAFSGKWRGLEVNRIGVGVPTSGNP